MQSENPPSLRAILFDLDATLINSRSVYDEAYHQAFRQVLGIALTPETRRQFMGLPSITFLRNFAEGERLEALACALRTNLDAIMHRIHLFPGLEEVLVILRQRGVRTAVVTSQNSQECRITRGYLQVDPWIDVWVTIDDVSHPKPNPEPVRLALERLQFDPEQAMMIGDTRFDLLAGRAAGTRIAAACWGADDGDALRSLKPDYVFQSPHDLRGFVCALPSHW